MNKSDIEAIVEKQRSYFESGRTLDIDFRISTLKKLKNALVMYEKELCTALYKDLGKSETEAYMCEIGMVHEEISFMLKNIKKLARARRVKTPIAQFPSKSRVLPSPYGNVLIMSPWNYPVNLTLCPLVDALAAGNTAIVKPSAYSPETSDIIEKIIAECFKCEYVTTVTGGRLENTSLLESKFDYIFFTGSQAVGREVLRHAAENLTPVALELGGKSPCIVTESADIPLAAKRIVFGKFLNCGQTCVAPDYILCKDTVAESLIKCIKREIALQFGEKPLINPDYGKMVSKKHYDRVSGLIDENKTVCGGEKDEDKLKIAPTVMFPCSWSDAVMGEEIFGPVLPILTFPDRNDAIMAIEKRQKPLALYVFSTDKAEISEFTTRVRFGGGCVNDVIIHLATTEMGFGGVGESGMGAYHGKVGFDSFSHMKSIVNKSNRLDLPMRYQPYTDSKLGMIKRFMK